MLRSLGAVLRERDLVSEDTLTQALHVQTKTGGRLGDVLLGSGALGTLHLYQALAEHYGLRFIDLLQQPPEEGLARARYLESYIALKVIPWRRELGALTFATAEPSERLDDFIMRTHGDDYKLVVTSPMDIRLTIEQRFADELKHISVDGLYSATPERSAKSTLTRLQRLIVRVTGGALVLAIAVAPLPMAVLSLTCLHVLYAVTMAAKCLWHAVGVKRMRQAQATASAPLLPDHALPNYTILVPLFREAAVLPALLRTLSQIDYPKDKLDIKLVLEASDAETFEAAKRLRPSYHFDIIRVPASQPQTKPKALNYALRFARGDLVTIFDAEDHPEPDQLRKAASVFAAGDAKLACVQARLQYFNAHENWLTRWFEIEYQTLFGPLMHALVGSRTPIPLGGTSNHINLRVLKSLGEWDPYNVTEDADLGVRLAASGYQTAMLNSVTYEEAPISLWAWVRQRSRWVKGHMQTWMVYMRAPDALYKTLKAQGFFGFHLVMGMSWVTFITAPVLWGLTLAAYHYPPLYIAASAVPALEYVAMFNLVSFVLLCWVQALRVSSGRGLRFALAAVTYPAYWALHSLASYKALVQLITRPHYWEKTNHGVSRVGNLT
jgi:glycosyltransferase XagB